ncbi:Cobalt-zinc-cadmium resistance protein CzcA, Cation efflux system protein CusA [Klebsiella michiganensis]|uniref:Cobalt-zinc-cadmium resistance protein CzcA, Cation efflux system protein CusA n=1 Tax=Klebsiella michiganensis TaxID=1134687 RepID=A0A7H4MYU2_9ENTR|nr:Cobalt-zinc-cadmium resistance protein CzcA, Cation efflux system protein CusA [Klebsiella michiganensis]
MEIVPVYDRSQLIKNSVETLTHKLIEEFIVVAVVCSLFLFHFRSALVAMITLPLGILGAFIVMHYQGRQRQYDVARRDCDRHRGHGRCGNRDDRKYA